MIYDTYDTGCDTLVVSPGPVSNVRWSRRSVEWRESTPPAAKHYLRSGAARARRGRQGTRINTLSVNYKKRVTRQGTTGRGMIEAAPNVRRMIHTHNHVRQHALAFITVIVLVLFFRAESGGKIHLIVVC